MENVRAGALKIYRYLTESGIPYREIGRISGVHEKTVRAIIGRKGHGQSRILAQLEAIIPEDWDKPCG